MATRYTFQVVIPVTVTSESDEFSAYAFNQALKREQERFEDLLLPMIEEQRNWEGSWSVGRPAVKNLEDTPL